MQRLLPTEVKTVLVKICLSPVLSEAAMSGTGALLPQLRCLACILTRALCEKRDLVCFWGALGLLSNVTAPWKARSSRQTAAEIPVCSHMLVHLSTSDLTISVVIILKCLSGGL